MNEQDFEQLRQAGNAPALDSQAELIALRAERDALIAALSQARDSLLDIRDISKPYDYIENPPGYELSRICSHAEIGLRHSEAAANKHGMEKSKKP